jgi:hypothetical protein
VALPSVSNMVIRYCGVRAGIVSSQSVYLTAAELEQALDLWRGNNITG